VFAPWQVLRIVEPYALAFLALVLRGFQGMSSSSKKPPQIKLCRRLYIFLVSHMAPYFSRTLTLAALVVLVITGTRIRLIIFSSIREGTRTYYWKGCSEVIESLKLPQVLKSSLCIEWLNSPPKFAVSLNTCHYCFQASLALHFWLSERYLW
jgi:hypothetical protein